MAEPRPHPERVPLHLAYFLLFALGILSGLWLHGHPVLTLVLLIAVLPLSLVAYIPKRFLNDEVRQILHYLVASAAVAWGIYRFAQHPPVDVMLIEIFAILGLSFAFTSHQRGHSLMMMISVVLVFYGSVAPPRSLYVWLVPVSLLLALVLLYQSRIASLSGEPDIQTRDTVSPRNLPWILVHAGLVLALWGGLVVVFPTPSWNSTGLAPVSFQTRNQSILPPRFQTWFQSPFKEAGENGDTTVDGNQPQTLDEQALTKVQNAEGEARFSPESGGSGFPGDDLVMRVKAPIKLYWLGQMYDQYDGETWSQSKAMTRQHLGWRTFKRQRYRNVKQTYIIEKWVSPNLYGAYLRANRLTPLHSSPQVPPILREDFAGVELAFPDQPQPVPFAYEVQSLIDLRGEKRSEDVPEGWHEKVAPEHYLKLPEKAISERVQNLALRLTSEDKTPLENAYAIRDYLRDNYAYELSTKPRPEGQEPVDYFLFDLREGHCEYFAAAMTVLCRVAGLPARVCTGFSPGNYNVLTEMFEVYEYHAHAWTQVFIPGRGWLTLDATPEGSLPTRSRTSPPMIGNLRNPHSDEWRIQTPELSQDTQAYIRDQMARSQQQQAQQRPGQAPGGTPGQASSETSTDEGIAGAMQNLLNGGDGDGGEMTRLEAFTTNVKALLQRVQESLRRTLEWLRQMIFSWYVLLSLILLLAVRLILPRLRSQLARRRRLRRSQRLYDEAEASLQNDPGSSIFASYSATRGLLDLAGLAKQEPNKDLLEYLQEDVTPELREPARELFQLYMKLEYQPVQPGAHDAERAFSRARQLRELLLPRIEHPNPSQGE